MSKTDPIADYLTCIRNATQAKHRKVDVPASNLKRRLTEILQEEAFIKNHVFIEDGKQGVIRIYLKYDDDNNSVISGIKRVDVDELYDKQNYRPKVASMLGKPMFLY